MKRVIAALLFLIACGTPGLFVVACATPGKTIRFQPGDFALIEVQLQG